MIGFISVADSIPPLQEFACLRARFLEAQVQVYSEDAAEKETMASNILNIYFLRNKMSENAQVFC